VGFVFGRVKKINLSALNDFVIYIATPSLILSSLVKDTIEIDLAGKVFVSVFVIIGLISIIGYLIIKYLNLSVKVYLPPIIFANTGNMGLPLILFAFGENGLKVGILYMVFSTIMQYTLGIMILSFDKSPLEVLKLPLIYSAIIGLIISVSEWSMPTVIGRAVDLLGQASIPTMIFSLGYKLSGVTITQVKRSLGFGAMRIGLGYVIGLFVAKLFNFNDLASNVVILESSMPPAVFNFVLAEKYNQDPKTVASIIFVGTLLSVITTPIIIGYLIN